MSKFTDARNLSEAAHNQWGFTNVKYKNEIIDDFCQIVDAYHGQRPDKLWFSTWIASKSPFFSFPHAYEQLLKDRACQINFQFIKSLLQALRLCLTLASLMAKSLISKMYFSKAVQRVVTNKKILLFRTFLYNPNIQEADPFWSNFYKENLKRSTVVVLFEPQFSFFDSFKIKSESIIYIPYFALSSPIKILKNFVHLIKEATLGQSLNTNTPFDELANLIYKREILSPNALVNLTFFDAFLKILQISEVQKCYIPFENNPWEKMWYLSQQKLGIKVQTIGFQHATVQLGATNYRLSKYEAESQLCPDKIVCVGEVTYNLLNSYPNYKNINLVIGCALRHSPQLVPFTESKKNKDSITTILVIIDGTAIASDIVLLMIRFCTQYDTKAYKIILREHPNLPLKKLLPSFYQHPVFLEKTMQLDTGKLSDTIKECDIVVYSSSTVSVEAMFHHKPLIHFQNRVFDLDPVVIENYLKWDIMNEHELYRSLQSFHKIGYKERNEKLQNGDVFVQKYFYKCTEENLEKFH